MTVPETYIAFAERLADRAGPIVKSYFRGGAEILDKDDHSPVTIADKEAEAAMRDMIEAEFPGHGILGEEHGAVRIGAEYVWVLDPIDGTKSFVTGKPLFGTLIALAQNGRPIVGVIDQPVLAERWVGAAGRDSLFNGKVIKTRACSDLSNAWAYATTPDMFIGPDADAYNALAGQVKHALYGADCYAYGLLASGFTDIVCEASLNPYDYCALVPVIEGAGGVITDWRGDKLTIQSDGRVIAAGDKIIHQAALKALNA